VQLTPHFDSWEFNSHDGATLPTAMRREYKELCQLYLEPLRRRFGPVSITSGHRSALWNARVGGAPESYHLWLPPREGVAADVRCRRGRPADWYAFLEGLAVGGLGAYGGFVHVDSRLTPARW